ncbi:CLUMA_CG006815, isoform A [Clunio marinus]|uniref:CLUMA_CG006815, isoform A n=1 Tax=Clunio marinus TaxID=568069 RepID=A0A1J1HYU2_9DIPT|nr:CLUMA_CG006815, isoform A [Clunio marinus]
MKNLIFPRKFDQEMIIEWKFWICTSVVVMLIYKIFHSKYFRHVMIALRTPGPKAYPIIGNCSMARESQLTIARLTSAYKLYGPIGRMWFSFLPVFIVFKPEYLQLILGSNNHNEKSFYYKLLHNFIGDGLITSSGEKWRKHRKFLNPIFNINIIEKFIEIFGDSAQNLIKKIKDEDETNVTTLINDGVLDILHESVFGIPADLNKDNSPFRQGKLVASHRVANPWLLFNSIYSMTSNASDEVKQKKRLDDFARDMIQVRREMMKDDDIKTRKPLVDYMLEISKNNSNFNEQDVVDEAVTFMLAGQDSVGASLAFSIALLTKHQDHQSKCYEELNEIFGDDDRLPTMNDLRNMKHLEMCIKEALRLYPAVPLFARCLGADIKCGETILPAGCNVFIFPYAIHRLESIYPEPEKFIPERFSPEQCQDRNPYAYLPFSAGSRNCIGHRFALIEMKVVISSILRNFKLLPVPGKTSIEPVFRITLRAHGGVWVRFEPRNNNVE